MAGPPARVKLTTDATRTHGGVLGITKWRQTLLLLLLQTRVTRARAEEACAARLAIKPTICPQSTPCDPERIKVNDEVTIDICLQSSSENPMVLSSSATIQVYLACQQSDCAAAYSKYVLHMRNFVPARGISASFLQGASRSHRHRCIDELSCGLLTLAGADVPLPARGDSARAREPYPPCKTARACACACARRGTRVVAP